MTKEEAKQYIKNHARKYLQPDKSKRGYICPVCQSGSGKKGTGITTKDGIHFTCWPGCFTNRDIIDIIGLEYGIDGYNGKLQKAAELFGIPLENDPPAGGNADGKQYTQSHIHNCVYTITHTQHENQCAEPDFTSFFTEAARDINKTDYHRGLTNETLSRFMIGYAENWTNPASPASPPSPRLIIPTGKGSYLARDTRRVLTQTQSRYTKIKVGKSQIFNAQALGETPDETPDGAQKPVFIVEGEIDALSIIDAGGEAVALGSTSNRKKLLEMLENKKPAFPLILALDNDEAGNRACGELARGLEALKIPFYRLDISAPYKDPNEALCADREAFCAAVKSAVSARAVSAQAETAQEKTAGAEREEYLKTSASNCLQAFIDGIAESVNTPFTPTGFKKLDGVLDGGLYEGLYVIGAISSLGKTTLISQIADQTAQAGGDVLIFSLEMARSEIMAKSISRLTLQSVLKNGGNIRSAKTARGITVGKRYENYSKTERDLINEAIRSYAGYADKIYISEGMGDIGAAQVRETVKKHIDLCGKTPVVIVDYLQILAPYSERATDKQNTDKAVLELKRISRDYKTPVIAISSFNRANYKEAVTMEAFKESGAVEYSSDVLIGLQLSGAGGRDFDTVAEKKRDPRRIELVILKNRNGRVGDKIDFNYYPLFNYFAEQ